ncbi:MAG: anthrone oxygenase family protein [Oligoflexus sp.]
MERERVRSAIKLVLWIYVINLGIAFGAGLYEARVEIPQWFGTTSEGSLFWNAEAARESNSGLRFWAFISTGPLTLLTLASLFLARKFRETAGKWWFGSALLSLGERIFTFTYFIPVMLTLMEASSGFTNDVVSQAVQWERLNYLRHALSFFSWFAALKALVNLR